MGRSRRGQGLLAGLLLLAVAVVVSHAWPQAHGPGTPEPLEALTGHPTGWHGCGGIRIATNPEEVDWFRHVAGFAANVGFQKSIM